MSNINLKITVEKNWSFQTFNFSSYKNCLQVNFWRIPIQVDIIHFLNFLFQFKNLRYRSKSISWIDQTRVVSYEFKNKIASCKKHCELELKWELGIDLYELGK